MTTTFEALYGTSNQTITITQASLANNGQRNSTVVSNTSALNLDALVQVKIKSGAASTSSTGFANVYAYASADGGTTYGDTATGSDAGVTLTVPNNLIQIGVVNIVANATTYKSNPMSVAAAFGGVLPEKWGIVVENKCGGTWDATGGNFGAFYQGVLAQGV